LKDARRERLLTLAFVQDWTVKYKEGGNIGIVPEQGGGPNKLGVFLLDTPGGGYEQDTIFSDGPIIYGTGMSNEDRAKAWKHFFMQMVEEVNRQQGADALGVSSPEGVCPVRTFARLA
jgi:hypothetical protein